MTENRERVRTVVIEELEDIAPRFAGRIGDGSSLLADLRLTGDDATALALLTSRRLSVKPPVRAWDNVVTVGDVIELLYDHITRDPVS
jgi:acyl carrier protein